MVCAVTLGRSSFASSFIAYSDCQARTIGEQGYLALAAPGSSISILIGILITILIAFVGYRLLLGTVPTLREGVMTLMKIGFVVAFATGWPAYRQVIYDVAINAPGELGATIGGAATLPGGAGDLAAHLDAVDQQFDLLSIDNVNRPFVPPPPGTVAPPLFPGFDVFAIGAARVIFLLGAIGGYCATRLIAGLLLALGPLFIAFALFDTTLGLVEGWLKTLAGTVLGTLATAIILGAELSLLEPWLASLIAVRDSDTAIPGAAAQLLAATTLFFLTLLAAIGAAAWLTRSLRLTLLATSFSISAPFAKSSGNKSTMIENHESLFVHRAPRSRARSIADAVTAMDRRESAIIAGSDIAREASYASSRSTRIVSGNGTGAPIGSNVAESATSRRTINRLSASAQRRDLKS